MEKVLLSVVSNKKLTENVYEMKFKGDVSAITAPGQFVEIKIAPPDICVRRGGRRPYDNLQNRG